MDEEGVWEIIDVRPEPGHYGEWFLARLGGKPVAPVGERDPTSGTLWVAVRDR